MQKDSPKRIAVIGLPGSGKSTFAIQLGQLLNIPVHHLDSHCFTGRVKRDHCDFVSLQQAIIDQESWIIEGCSIKTLDMRFKRADTVIYLDFPRFQCIWRVFKRAFSFNPILSNSGCANFVNWTLLIYIWTFKKEKRPIIDKLRAQYPHLAFHLLKNEKELELLVKNLKSPS